MAEIQTKNFRYRTVVIFILLAGLMYLGLNAVVNTKIDNLNTILKVQLSEQQALIASTADLAARNGADAVTESIVRDCPVAERLRFDKLLGTLNSGLTTSELNELDRLFGRCATFSSQRKSIMVSRLSREVEIYAAYVNQFQLLTNETEALDYQVEKWQALATAEKKESDLFNQLVTMQEQIIKALLEGKSQTSNEISEILAEVQQTQQTLSVANKQSAQLRSDLIPL